MIDIHTQNNLKKVNNGENLFVCLLFLLLYLHCVKYYTIKTSSLFSICYVIIFSVCFYCFCCDVITGRFRCGLLFLTPQNERSSELRFCSYLLCHTVHRWRLFMFSVIYECVTCSSGHVFSCSSDYVFSCLSDHVLSCSSGLIFKWSHVHMVSCSIGLMFTWSHVQGISSSSDYV